MKALTSTLTILLFFILSANAQTLINKNWQDTTGHPSTTYQLQCAKLDASGNLYTAGSTYHAGQSDNLLVTKYNSTGTKLWQKEYDSPASYADILTDFYIKGSSYYATGTYWDSAHSKSWLVALRGNTTTGDTIWTRTYNGTYGGYDAGGTVKVDVGGGVIVGGTDQQSSTNFRMIAIKYDSVGVLKWTNFYDSAGYYDGAVDMAITATTTGYKVAMTGFSGSGFSSWDFITATFNTATGAVIGTPNRSANAAGAFSQPTGIVKDNSDNLYIAGTAAITGTNTDIKIIKYDTAFHQSWLKIWGNADSLKDEVSALSQDVNNNLLITGSTTQPNGAKSMLVLKYNTSGTLQWSQTVSAPNSSKDCLGKDIVADDSSNIYVTGSINNGSNNDFITVCLDKNGNIKWERTYAGGGSSDDKAFDIVVDNTHNVYVSGSSAAASTKYVTLAYGQLDLSSSYYSDTSGNPLYLKHQILLKLDTSAITRSEINGSDKNFWQPKEIMKQWLIDSLKHKYANFEKCYLARIFNGLKTTDTISISRRGERIPIPTFWSTFVLVDNTVSPLPEKKLCDTLNRLFPIVEFAELDVLASLSSAPNDPFYTEQYGLFPPLVYPGSAYPDAGIDVEGAWNFTTGKPYIKLGVFDEGIGWTHKDFRLDTTNELTSIVKGGQDLFLNASQLMSTSPISGPHGTMCAGLIAARRNNGTGIAGVAGGNGGDSTTGCSLYGYKIIQPSFNVISASKFAAALILASTQTPDTSFGTGIHAINHSYKFNSGEFTHGGYLIDSNKTIWRNAIRYSFRNKVVNCFATGNDGYEVLPEPMRLDDDWLLVVGGTGAAGNFHALDDAQDPDWTPNIGFNTDIGALCSIGVIPATWPSSTLYPGDGYTADFGGGTSASAPLATGTTGLLMSYLNKTTPNYKNLAPEDVEYILQRSAFNIDTSGYDLLTGWGRLNAGGAFTIVDTSKRELRHKDSDSIPGSTTVIQKIDTSKLLRLFEDEKNASGLLFDNIQYKFDVYKVTRTIPQSLPSTDTIVAYWPRSSSSFVYPAPSYDSDNFDSILIPREHVYVQSVSNANVVLYGYVYKVKNRLTNALVGWLPMDTTQVKSANFGYSLLVGHTFNSPWDSIISNVVTVTESGYAIRLYPNPSSNTQLLEVELEKPTSQISVTLYDSFGNLVKEIYSGKLDAGQSKWHVDLSGLQSGVYIYSFQNSENNGRKFMKTIKF